MTGDTAGGVFTFVTELALGLTASGYDVTLATFGPEPKELLRNIRWFHHVSRLEWQEDPWEDLQPAGTWLQSIAAAESPDLVHLNTLCHGDLNWAAPVVTTIHSCVPTWWSQVKQSNVPAEWNRYRQVVRQSLEAASLLVSPTRALLDLLIDAWPVDFSSALVIPNGLDQSQCRRLEKSDFVLAVGRFWDEAKNVKALASVAKSIPWPIYLAGESGNASECRVLGHLSRNELFDWYARASIFVSPARYEPFGLSVLEAAMSGCALLLSDIPSFRENWSGAAMFVRPEELEAGLNTLIADEPLRRDLQRKAKERSCLFSREAMTANYVAAYQHVGECLCVS